jgi:predicted nucleic acid-binding Zn ribbon protein
MISEVRNNPHGAEFKSWAAKVSKAFAHKGVEVTTKHSYQIAYKYIWECVVCGYEFKRHSKSVDPARHSCGRCKGKLVQTKPTPRVAAKGADGKPKEKSEYQVFVKANYSKVKEKLAAEGKEVSLGKVMAVVAEEYKIWKEKRDKKAVVEVEELFEGLKIQEGDA